MEGSNQEREREKAREREGEEEEERERTIFFFSVQPQRRTSPPLTHTPLYHSFSLPSTPCISIHILLLRGMMDMSYINGDVIFRI